MRRSAEAAAEAGVTEVVAEVEEVEEVAG